MSIDEFLEKKGITGQQNKTISEWFKEYADQETKQLREENDRLKKEYDDLELWSTRELMKKVKELEALKAKHKIDTKCKMCGSTEDIRVSPVTYDCMDCGATWKNEL